MAKKRTAKDIFLDILGENFVEPIDYSKLRLPSAAPESPKTDFAQYLLTHSFPKGPYKASTTDITEKEGAEYEEPSLISRIIDTASAPLYAITNTIQDVIDDPANKGKPWYEKTLDFGDLGQNVAAAGARMLSGSTFGPAAEIPGIKQADEFLEDYAARENKPILGSQLLEQAGVDNKIAKYGGGFLLDLALDPISWVPGIGFAKMAGRAATGKRAVNVPRQEEANRKGMQKIQEAISGQTLRSPQGGRIAPPSPTVAAPRITESLTFQNPQVVSPKFPNIPLAKKGVNPATPSGAREIAYNILNDPESLANMRHPSRNIDTTAQARAASADRMRDLNLAKKGKVYDGKGHVSARSVTEYIEAINRGEILRFANTPASATGIARESAIDIADRYLTNNLLPATGRRRIDFNPANQANLYNRMYNAARESLKEQLIKSGKSAKQAEKAMKGPTMRLKTRVEARAMLRTAEDHMIRLGKHPVYWDGLRLRLSDVLEEVGLEANDELATKVMKAFVTKDMRKIDIPEVREAINLALARRAHVVSDVLENATKYAQEAKEGIWNLVSGPEAYFRERKLVEAMKTLGDNLGLTHEEIDSLKDIVRNVIDVDKTPAEKFLPTLGRAMIEAHSEGRVTKELFEKFNKAIVATVGVSRDGLTKGGIAQAAVQTFMTRMTTWYGRGAMKAFAKDVFEYGEMNAVLRARLFRNMIDNHSEEVIVKAFQMAQDPQSLRAVAPFDPEVTVLSNQIREYFESILGSSGLSTLMMKEGKGWTPARLSGMVAEDVNKYLKAQGSDFQFLSKKVKHKTTGVPRDYTEKGVGWVASWELADAKKIGQKPSHLMYDIDLAIEKTMKEYALVDEFIMRFGKHADISDFNPNIHTAQVVHKRIPKGVYFEPEVAKQFRKLLDDLSDMYVPSSKIMRHYSRGLRAWKTGVTIYIASHHIRNMIGDLHLMWWAGHNDPRNFIRARRVLQTQRRYLNNALKQDTFKMLNDYTSREALDWAATKGGDIILRQNGMTLTADELYIAAHQHGLLLDANKAEDIFGESPLQWRGRNIEPLGGKAHHVAATVAEYREHYVRMSHFIGAVNKRMKKSKDMKWILDDAAHEVRKWHPDGRDLTGFEQKWLRNIIPFYSWTRKALPLVVQSFATRPAKVMYYPRGMYELQGALGLPQNEEGVLDPYPNDQYFPEWLRARGIAPIGDPESNNMLARWFGHLGRNMFGIHGQETGYTVIDPSNPFNDVIESLVGFGNSPLDVGRSAFDMSTPAIKIPGELFVSKEKFSGAPIAKEEGGEGILAYLAEQVPILSPVQNVAELGKEPRPGKEGNRDWQAFLNYLTALGVRGTGPYEKSAEFEVKQRIKQLREQELRDRGIK